MKCPRCGTDLPEDARFCANCGGNLQNQTQVQPIQSINQPQQINNQKRKKNVLIPILLVVIVLAVLAVIFVPKLLKKDINRVEETNDIVEFEADIYMLKSEEGGRQTPFFNEYKPEFYFRETYYSCIIILPSNVEMVSPGDRAHVTIELTDLVEVKKGTEFQIREGGRIIATGTVTK